ncbi:protease Do-like 2, chloroplastic isoform X1 [Salvia hispanica]|uniref:protease Do-like 2, chloroplastic isoform X1 n=1 Tax=Salvia hispanica TaxID=49212 RepID=UPI0020092513|nr:protease Do-like 2, chloroplastic isoform X1 [Salvia hispanica]
MAVAAANCCFFAAAFTGRSTTHRLFYTLRTPNYLYSASYNQNPVPVRGKPKKSPSNYPIEKLSRRSKDEKSFSNSDGSSGRTKNERSQSTTSKRVGVEKKGSQGFLADLDEQKVDTSDIQDASFLNAVVKVYCTHTEPDYSLPWQKQKQYTSTGSAFMIGDGKLLTNAHCVEYNTQVKVKRRGDDTKYIAKVLTRGVECDLALLFVESKEFWEGTEPLQFGRLPNLQDSVTVVGYPLGGETISVSKGVVSRIEVTSYAHGSSDLLGIQIDAAINPGNSGGPAFNDLGECIGVAFQVYRSDEVENIGYVIPTTVVSHFLEDYERNGKYTGFPCLGVLLQKLENPALRACLNVPSNEGVLVRKVEPTSHASHVLKEGDVIVSFNNVRVGCEGTVPFRPSERIAFRYLISQKFTGDVAELGIIRGGQSMQVQVTLDTRVHLVPYHIEGDQPSYLIIAGLVFTPLSEPLIAEECEDSIGLKLLTKARYSMPRFRGEQIVILSQVLANDENIGYEDMSNEQVLKLNGTWIKNIHHLTHLVDSCKDKYLVFEFEDNFLVVLERESVLAASKSILKGYGIPSERSDDLLAPYVDPVGQNDERKVGDSAVSDSEIGNNDLHWA